MPAGPRSGLVGGARARLYAVKPTRPHDNPPGRHDTMSEHDEHQDDEQPQHAEFDPRADDKPAEPAAPEHAGLDDAENDAGDDGELTIPEEWGGDYPPGTRLFCANFDAEDFSTEWGEGDFAEGATVAIKRGTGTPPQGWIIRHAHLSDLERTKAILERHASPDALAILYSLNDTAFDAFVEAWGKDGGMTPGKSRRSARRSGNTKRR